MRRLALSLALLALATPLRADPAPPQPGPLVASLQVGVFCAL